MVPPFVVMSPLPHRGLGFRGKGCAAARCRSSPRDIQDRVLRLGRRTMRRLAGSKESIMNKPDRLASAAAEAEFQMGGVRLCRPFRIRRLGHFGVNVADPEKSKDFYCRLLGFRISDPIDFEPRLPQDKR